MRIMMIRAVMLLILICLQVNAWGAGSQEGVSNEKPEDVVIRLMEFDFNGGYRENPDTYPAWFVLTTNGLPLYSTSSPYWSCPLVGILHSYKVIESELVSPEKANVVVEVEMAAISVLAGGIDKYEHKCDWSGFSSSGMEGNILVSNISHPIAAKELLAFMTGNDFEQLCISKGFCSSREGVIIPLPEAYRKWQYKFEVIFATSLHGTSKRWLIPTSKLPRPFVGLKSAITHQHDLLKSFKHEIEICSNHLQPPSVHYKEAVCPSVRLRETEFVRAANKNLNTLNAIEKGYFK